MHSSAWAITRNALARSSPRESGRQVLARRPKGGRCSSKARDEGPCGKDGKSAVTLSPTKDLPYNITSFEEHPKGDGRILHPRHKKKCKAETTANARRAKTTRLRTSMYEGSCRGMLPLYTIRDAALLWSGHQPRCRRLTHAQEPYLYQVGAGGRDFRHIEAQNGKQRSIRAPWSMPPRHFFRLFIVVNRVFFYLGCCLSTFCTIGRR